MNADRIEHYRRTIATLRESTRFPETLDVVPVSTDELEYLLMLAEHVNELTRDEEHP